MLDSLFSEPRAFNLLPLHVEGVGYRRRGRRLLHDVSFSLRGESVSVIMGPNGAGKSLLLQILHGLLAASEGTIGGDGYCLSRGHRHATSIVLQSPVLLRRSVADNLRVALRAAGQPRHIWESMIDLLLAWGHLRGLRHQAARLLSGGEKQCLCLLRALVSSPQLLLLDEPCANLDPRSVSAVENLIGKAVSEGVKICLVTHDIAQAKRLGDEIIFIHKGEVCEVTEAKVFFAAPRSEAGRRYLAGELLL